MHPYLKYEATAYFVINNFTNDFDVISGIFLQTTKILEALIFNK